MGLHWTTLSTNYAGYGSVIGPGHATSTSPNEAGIEDNRFARMDQARRQFTLTNSVRTRTDATTLIDFVLARRGAAHSFLLQDPTDYSTAADGFTVPTLGNPSSTPTIGTGDGTRRQWQLVKEYGSTGSRHLRGIVPASVVCSVNGVSQTEGTDFVVDHTLGTILFVAAPTSGHAIKAGCLFYNVVRFDESVDTGLAITKDDLDRHTIATGMVEDAVMTTAATGAQEVGIAGTSELVFPGGGRNRSGISGTVQVLLADGWVQWFNSLTAAVTVQLPDVDGGGSSGHADIAPFGSGGAVAGGYYRMVNDDSTYDVTLTKWNGSAWVNLDPIYTVAAGKARDVFLDAAGIWRAR